eukprot:TRINITY_DN21230_c0_g1_i1.p1 TRINITY_DN21230_c0_g1~~TRINITY_DN21230_c0_g1_i1.p1  ORF type:complete len:140 (-),score=19.43 TRINITY_DN21230_c0_g1_i1:58-426(-)
MCIRDSNAGVGSPKHQAFFRMALQCSLFHPVLRTSNHSRRDPTHMLCQMLWSTSNHMRTTKESQKTSIPVRMSIIAFNFFVFAPNSFVFPPNIIEDEKNLRNAYLLLTRINPHVLCLSLIHI